MNKAILVGRVGKSPEVKNFDNGGKVANFSVATTETFKDKNGEKKEETTWHNINAWGKLAEIIEKFVKKGDLISLEGSNRNRTYKDSNNVDKYVHFIKADTVRILSSNNKPASASNETQSAQAMPIGPDLSDVENGTDDLPF